MGLRPIVINPPGGIGGSKITAQQQKQEREISLSCLPEMAIQPQLLQLLREREVETQLGQVQMNCEMCKFRLAAVKGDRTHGHHHHHHHHHHDTSAPGEEQEKYHHWLC